MAGLIENTLLMGLGALTLTHEKVSKFVEELVQEGEVKAEESKGLADKLIARGREEREELRKMIRQELNRMKPVSRKEFEALGQKVDELAAQPQTAGKKSPKKETPAA